MADAGSFNADLGINMQFNIDGAGLAEMTKTIKEISKGKDLQRYWKDVESATDSASKAIERYSKNVNSKGLAENLLKQINALKAITKNENLSELFPNIELNIDELVESAKKIVPKINSEFSVDSFSQAFKTFDLLKEKALDLREVFNMLANYSDLVSRNSELSRENIQFRELIGDSDVEEVKSKLSEIKRLRDQAEEIFTSFLKVNNVERTDYWGDEKFSDYFDAIRKGSLTATEAISRFKTEYAYLLEEGFKSNNDTFGLEQLQTFSNKLDSIFRQVEETSTKINDIISNGVITKSVENLSIDSSLSDSQRSLFVNLLKDEESLKSITALFQKLIEESNKTSKVDLFNDEQLQQVLSIFDKMEGHLSSLRSIISDVGDGEEFSPLLKALNDIKEAASNIKLNFNMDLGDEVSERLNQKVSQASARQLEAYRNLLSAMKGTGKTNKEMFQFFEPDDASVTELIGIYKGIIERAEKQFKVGNSNIYKKYLGSEYDALKREVTNANKQLSRADSKRSENGILGDLFGNTKDLSEVIDQLNKIVLKLDEISSSATEFKNVFKDGFNVTASIEEINKLTNRVKELEDELSKVKLNTVNVDKSNISSGMKDAFPSTGTKLDEAVTSAKDLDKTLEQVDIPIDSFDKVLEKLDRTKSELVDIVKITKQSVSDADGKFHDSYTLKDSRGSTEIYGVNSKTNKGQILRQNIVGYDSNAIAKLAQEEEKLTEAMAKGREQSEKARQAEQKRQELAQNNAINKALEEEYRQRQKLAQEEEKQIQKNKELALSYTESTSRKLSDAISKYSYGDSSDATAMMKQMNRGMSNFGNLSNIESNIKNFDSIVDTIITDLKRSHEESLSALNNEIKAEETMQKQKDAFNKSNLNAIDMEIQKREEEAKTFSNSLKALMESQQQAKSQISKFENTLSKYQTKTGGYDATIARFEDGGWTSDAYLKNVQAVKNAVNEYETLLNELKGKDASLVTSDDISKLDKYEKKIKDTIDTVTNMSAAEKGYNFVSAQKELDKIHKLLNENSKMSSEAKAKIKAYYAQIESGNPSMSLDKIHGEIMKIYNAEVEAGRAGRSFFDTLKNSGFHQIAAQMAGMVGIYDVINVVKEGINTVRELDTAMTEVRKVSDATEAQYASFRDTISSTAKEIASTNKELLNSSADFLRLGYSLEQAEDLAKNATLFVNVGDGVDITEATEDMITAMKAFDIQAEDSIKIVDDYNQIGNKYALSATDIGEAMKRSASALEVGNNSFEESIGLITAMNEIVQNSENTGNSLKVLSLRLRGAKAELEDMGEDTDGLCDSTSKLREQVKALSGVDIMEDDNTFKSTAKQVKELGEAFVKLDDVSQAALLEIIAGKSRSNAVAALLKNYQQIDNVIADLDDAEGSALRENEAIVDSIDGRIKVLSATAEEFWQKFIDTDFVKNAVSLASDFLGLLTQIIDKFGTLPTIATGIGAALSFKNVGILELY